MGYLLAHQGEVLAHLIRQALATRQFIAQDAQGAERCAQAVRGTRRQVTKTNDIGIAGTSGARLEQRGLAEGNTSTPGDFIVERAFAER